MGGAGVSAHEEAIARLAAEFWRRVEIVSGYVDGVRAAQANTRQSHMHTAYRAKTRRRNRRTK
jgi:hypothetical protein